MLIDFQFFNEESVPLIYFICHRTLNSTSSSSLSATKKNIFLISFGVKYRSNFKAMLIILYLLEKNLSGPLAAERLSLTAQKKITDYIYKTFYYFLGRVTFPKILLMPVFVYQVECTDPSRMVRPEPIFANKPIEAFRQYEGNSSIHERVFRTYKLMHTHQTTEFAQRKV